MYLRIFLFFLGEDDIKTGVGALVLKQINFFVDNGPKKLYLHKDLPSLFDVSQSNKKSWYLQLFHAIAYFNRKCENSYFNGHNFRIKRVLIFNVSFNCKLIFTEWKIL